MASEASAYVFFGSDEGAAGSAALKAYTDLTAGGDGWGDEMIDGAAATADEAVSIIQRTVSGLQMFNMFGGRKVIWLKGATFLADTPSGARSEAVQEAMEGLAAALENLPADKIGRASCTERV